MKKIIDIQTQISSEVDIDGKYEKVQLSLENPLKENTPERFFRGVKDIDVSSPIKLKVLGKPSKGIDALEKEHFLSRRKDVVV